MIRSSLCTLVLFAYPFKRRGRKKLVRFFSNWLKTPMLWRGAYGVTYLLNPKNYIDARILREGMYEKKLVEYFCHQIEQVGADIFLDVGANIGVYSLAVLRATKVNRILAFEPDPKNRNQLCASIFLNEADSLIEVRSEALSDKSGESILYAQRDKDVLSTVQSSLEPIEAQFLEVPVSILAFDDFHNWQGENIAIKMDIEGHEAMALKGMEQLIRNNVVFLQVECFDKNLEYVRGILNGYGLKELPQLDVKYHDYYFTNAKTLAPNAV